MTETIVKERKCNKRGFQKFFALVMMQLRDKVDLSWIHNKKKAIQKIVLSILSFVLITLIAWLFITVCVRISIIFTTQVVPIAILFLSIMFVMSTITSAIGLMNNLYYSEDNKVLATLPISSSGLFFSKLVVYYIYEVIKNIKFFIPLLLGFFIATPQVGVGNIFFAIIPLFLIIGIPVLFGAILSIPCLYISRLFKKVPIVQFVIVIISAGLVIGVILHLISLIPSNIDFANQWPVISETIKRFLEEFVNKMNLTPQLMYAMVGNYNPGRMKYFIQGSTIVRVLIIVALLALLIVIMYFAIKPLFYKMISKSFEFDKKTFDEEKPNVQHKLFITFVNKEIKINIRSVEISGSYIAVYIIIPILIMLLNTMFNAVDTKLSGVIMTYSFNILLILLPLLASNAQIATLYSQEGRAGYMKKTKPVNPLMPLFSKLLFNLALSLPCILITMFIFAKYSNFGALNTVVVAFGILFLQYGHIFYSATLDIMNPQNEQYATVGEEIYNPNENKSTIMAFVIAFLFALASYKLLDESYLDTQSFLKGSIKLFLIAMIYFSSTFILFVLKIKAYYFEK